MEAYRKAWKEMFTHFKGQSMIGIRELSVMVDGIAGFGHSFQHLQE
ncbi:MAG TPA: hypothetical protein VNT20_20985 [Flavisolibacter sp.]|jgi:ketosteroid isomerase-like protein|nr:hypothetical protein [Flavisolibacter sp.]